MFINTAHPAYLKAGRRNLLGYHERLAIYYAVVAEAPVDPAEKLILVNQAITEWGKAE